MANYAFAKVQNYGYKSLMHNLLDHKQLTTVWVFNEDRVEWCEKQNSNLLCEFTRENGEIPQVLYCKGSKYILLHTIDEIEKFNRYIAVYIPEKDFKSYSNLILGKTNKELDIEKDLASVMKYREKLLKELAVIDDSIEKYSSKRTASQLYHETRAEIKELQNQINGLEIEMGVNIPVIIPSFK